LKAANTSGDRSSSGFQWFSTRFAFGFRCFSFGMYPSNPNASREGCGVGLSTGSNKPFTGGTNHPLRFVVIRTPSFSGEKRKAAQ
jgi:hypothetical protein